MGGTRTSRLNVVLLILCALPGAQAAASEISPAPTVTLKLSAAQVEAAGIRLQVVTEAKSASIDSAAARGIRLAGRVATPGDASGVILSTVSGQLDAVLVQIGASVRAGQPLARIASPELATLQSEYFKARTSAELAERRMARDESLFDDGIISEARLQDTRTARQLALAAEQEQRRHLTLAGLSASAIRAIAPSSISGSVTIHAPAETTVLAQSATIGQHVEPGTELFRLAGARGAWLELHAPARNANAIRVGDIVSVEGCDSPGRVIGVASQLDPESQTFLVRAEIEDATCVQPNQYVEADVSPGSVPAGLVSIASSALVRNANRDYVFVERDGTFSPQPVNLERRHGGVAWLRGGVSAGARVATAGVTALKGAWLGFGAAVEASGAE